MMMKNSCKTLLRPQLWFIKGGDIYPDTGGNVCDAEEDATYQDRTGYELPADLAFKQQRLKAIKAAKTALEAREEALHPGEPIDAKKQISFADTEARIMGKKGDFDYRYNGQIKASDCSRSLVSVDSDHQVITGQPQDCASSRLYLSLTAIPDV